MKLDAPKFGNNFMTMPKKELTPLKLETPEQFGRFLHILWDELYWANFYYDMFKETGRLCTEHKDVFSTSPFFWHFTLKSHCQTALVYLHRVYDQNKQSFNLHRFLLTVGENRRIFDSTAVRARRAGDSHVEDLIRSIGVLDLAQLDRDIAFSSNTNPMVANLNQWRDRITFHKDERELFRQKPFEDDHPLPFATIEQLLEGGFRILKRYWEYFDTTQPSLGCREWNDVKFLFER